eukprot:1139421-Pelagomonas_calceolata.AAC.11
MFLVCINPERTRRILHFFNVTQDRIVQLTEQMIYISGLHHLKGNCPKCLDTSTVTFLKGSWYYLWQRFASDASIQISNVGSLLDFLHFCFLSLANLAQAAKRTSLNQRAIRNSIIGERTPQQAWHFWTQLKAFS